MKCFFLMNGNGNGNGEKKTSSKSSASASTWTSMDPPDITKSAASSSEFNSSDMSTTTTAESSSTQRTSFAAGSLSTNHQQNLRVFTVSELKSATKNFSRSLIIGEGGFGSVYKGLIKTTAGADPQSKLTVAVKQLGKRGLQGHKEWVTEVNVLGVVDHPNLVKLVGYCADDDERGIQRLLIYEYMPNRSVEDHLSAKSFTPLPWSRRLKIAQDAARGLAYLHEEMEFQIIFRDFKTSNILLDDQWNAKLSDFGLARLGPSEGLSHVSTAVVGTMGYAAPEYMQTGRLTAKSDVWSYGVVLYELLTGRRPLDKNRPRGEQKLLEWIRPRLSDMKKFKTILDPRLEGEYSIKSVQKLAAVANRCLVRHPKARPKMSEVYEMVKQIVEATEVEKPQDHQKIISEEAEMEKSDLKRKTVCDHIPKSGWFVWRSWRPKLARTC